MNETLVKNGLSSTNDTTNSYVCSNTNDKVFLLSEKELTTYYSSEDSRKTSSQALTNYAKIQDADYECTLLRSPYNNYAYSAKIVNQNGVLSFSTVNYALLSIRPVIVITL